MRIGSLFRFVVVENVPALLSRGLGVVLGDLAPCGYDATWDCIPAAAVGAPHCRYRLFIVAYAQGWRRHQSGLPSGAAEACASAHRGCEDGWPRALARVNGAAEPVADADSNEAGGLPGRASPADTMPSGASWWRAEPDVGRVADGVPARVDRLRALGNAVVPQVAEVVGRVLLQINEELLQ